MTNKVCIPVEIIRNSKLSPRARIIWAELSLLPRNEAGEFVIHQKELSNLLGICVSTLRRALKSLEENKLIEFVGLSDQHFKKFVFKSDGVDEKIPLPPFSKGELEPKPVEDAPLKSLFFQGGLNPELNPETIEDVPLKSPLEKGGRGILATSEPTLLKLKYQFAGPLTSEDKENLEYAQGLARPLHKLWIDRFPLLNGKDGRPLLNTDLIELIVLSHPSDLSGSKLIKVLISELQRYSDGQF